MPSSMICNKCKKIQLKADVCAYCGAKVVHEELPPLERNTPIPWSHKIPLALISIPVGFFAGYLLNLIGRNMLDSFGNTVLFWLLGGILLLTGLFLEFAAPVILPIIILISKSYEQLFQTLSNQNSPTKNQGT